MLAGLAETRSLMPLPLSHIHVRSFVRPSGLELRVLLAAACLAPLITACGGGQIGNDKLLRLAQATKTNLDPQAQGVWMDPAGAVIALVHKEGDEYRILLAAGDTRATIPQNDHMANALGAMPGAEHTKRAADALDAWGAMTGDVPRDRFVFAMAGSRQEGHQNVVGTFVEGRGACRERKWGNFYMHTATDADGDATLFFSIYATKKQIGGGLGGQNREFTRRYILMKRPKPIKPSVLDALRKADNFCRKTAG